ncbi:MAG: hypothetical protein J0I20_19910 [Chloroflexi bacterium]|nr:hypothetical protein [Chloroflexota bacterium]OJW06320.1 MAG: hypothetical protein BGO39_26185 [Chloroflexi bacterium 54-19]
MDLPTAPLNIRPEPTRPRVSGIAWFILFFLIADLIILAVILNWLISHSPETQAYQLAAPTVAVPSPSAAPFIPNPPLPTVTPAPTETPTPPPTATPVPPTATPQPTATPTPSQLLVNPNFELSWGIGWQQATGDDFGGHTEVKLLKHPAISSNALTLDHTGQTFTSIYQLVKVPSLQLRFSGQLAGYTSTNGFFGDSSGLTGLGLNFYYAGPDEADPNQPDASLLYVTGSKFRNGRAFGLYPLADSAKPGTVTVRSFDTRGQTITIANLQTEVQRSLPGLDLRQVQAVGITLFAGGSDNCNPDECIARLYAGSFQLKPLNYN